MSLIGLHGFPAKISVQDIVGIARDVGHELHKRQAAITAIAKGQQPPSQDLWVKTKPDGSSLTSSDIWANAEILSRLKHLSIDFNQTGVITEENEEDLNLQEAKKKRVFVIDPLDNTGDYKRGHDNWSVTIGFVDNGTPTGGIVYYPAQQRLYYTENDGKSYCLNERTGAITTLNGTSPKRADHCLAGHQPLRIVTDFNVSAQTKNLAQNVAIEHAGHTDRYWLPASPDGPDIAEHGDLFYAWDIVAPAAIAARANVQYVSRNGKPLNFLVSQTGHHPFEMPREGFIAGNQETLKNLKFLQPVGI